MRSCSTVIERREDSNITAFKAEKGDPSNTASCNAALINGYVVRTQIPATAAARMLETRPDAAGIAPAGMPQDAPGMGGHEETWNA